LMSLSCEGCVFSGRVLCVGLITRPEASYRLWCVCVWYRNPVNEEILAHGGSWAMTKKLKTGCVEVFLDSVFKF